MSAGADEPSGRLLERRSRKPPRGRLFLSLPKKVSPTKDARRPEPGLEIYTHQPALGRQRGLNAGLLRRLVLSCLLICYCLPFTWRVNLSPRGIAHA